MADRPPLPREEVQRILARLSPLSAEGKIVLIGAARSARLAADLIGGEVRIPGIDHNTPNTGQVLFIDSEGVEREIDFLSSPFGLEPADVRTSAVPMTVPDASGGEAPILVMHPERCMESRVHNVVRLGTTGEIAMTQLRRSIACSREWSRYLLTDESTSKARRVRAVLALNERVFRKSLRSQAFRRLALEHEIKPFEAVLVDGRLPDKFRERRYPQMVAAIEAARDRAGKHRDRYSRKP